MNVPKKLILVGSVLGAVVVTFLGHGIYWQWKSAELSAEQHHLQVLAERSVVYQRIEEEHEKFKSLRVCQGGDHIEAQRLRTSVQFLKSQFEELESELARLENRVRRDIEPDFVAPPCPPQSPRVE